MTTGDQLQASLEVLQSAALVQARKPFEERSTDYIRSRAKMILDALSENAHKKALKVYVNALISNLAVEDENSRIITARMEKAYAFVLDELQDAFDAGEVKPRNEEEWDTKDRETMRSFKVQENALRIGVAQRGLFAGTAPIVTMLSLRTELLNRAGVATTSIGMYPVLLNQMVLGVSASFIESQIEREMDVESSPMAKVHKRTRSVDSLSRVNLENQITVANQTLELFLARRRNLEVLGENGIGWAGSRWYWLAPKGFSTRLRAAAYGGDKAKGLSRWAFAFQPKADLPRAI